MILYNNLLLKKNKLLLKWCSLLLFIFVAVPSFATHIVGGEMTYKCLGNNEYELRLVIYRDCYNGNPGAYFDNPAYVGLYNQSGDLVDELEMPWLMVDDTLSPTLSGECLVAPPDVCVHTSFYLDTIQLQPIPGGYTLYYQRCCRNGTINNIISPLTTGATFSVSISETAMLECNSSAQFNNWPPILICVNEPVDFDHSASDSDGDSLVYSLCTPLDGATQLVPYPTPSQQTIPNPVVWQAPYSGSNMLGGVPLTINPQTGFLTGIPNTVGQFVVGVCVEEYRDGNLISTTRRDFQYNVGVCGQPTAAFFAPDVQCGNLSVSFDNNSASANSFLWLFNDPGNPGASSSQENPSYTFSDTGTYEVILIVNPGTTCADTAYQSITLQPSSLIANFSWEITECNDSAVIQVSDNSIDPLAEPVSWQWTLNSGGLLLATSTEQNPSFTVYESNLYAISLVVTSNNGCSDEVKLGVPIELLTNVSLLFDSIQICPGEQVGLNPNGNSNPNYQYSWSPQFGLDNPFVPNPIASPDSAIVYSVIISSMDSVCQKELSVAVFVPEFIGLTLPSDTTICASAIQIAAEAAVPAEFFWSESPDFVPILATDSIFLASPIGSITFYVLAVDAFNCKDTAQVNIIGNSANILTPPPALICPGDTTILSPQITDLSDIINWNWFEDSLLLNPDSSSIQLTAPFNPGPYWFGFEATNQYDCQFIDSILVQVLDTTPQLDFVFSQQCGGFSVQFTNTSVNAPFLLWDFGDMQSLTDTSSLLNPEYIYPDTGFYTVMLTVVEDIPCKDTIFKEIYVGNSNIDIDFGWEIAECSDSITVQFTDLSSNNQSTILNSNWFFGNGESAEGEEAVVIFSKQDIPFATLVLESSDGCIDSLTENLPLFFLQVDTEDTLYSCPGNAVFLFPDADTSLKYQWEPSLGLNDPLSPNPLAIVDTTITYFLLALEVNGTDTCKVNRKVTVLVLPQAVANISGDTVICADETLTLLAEAPDAASYTWSFVPDFAQIEGVAPVFESTPDSIQWIYLKVVNQSGCTVTDSILITNAGIDLIIPDLKMDCRLDTLRPAPENLNPFQILNFNWFSDQLVVEGGDSPYPLIQGFFEDSIIWTVTNQYGCTQSGAIYLDILSDTLQVSATAKPDTITAGELVLLEAQPVGNYEYAWQPSTLLNDPQLNNPESYPSSTTTFEVTVLDTLGCPYRASVRVVVRETTCADPYIFIPNIFSPDGDGKNDRLFVRGNNIDEMHLIVYNRWGNQVFESRSQEVGWDGTYKGEMLNTDVFGYYLTVKCFNGERWVQKGNITLLR